MRPGDLADVEIAHAVATGWGIEAAGIEYAAVGFGSYHWTLAEGERRWFATVDDLEARRRHSGESRVEARRRLAAALNTANGLHHRAKLAFVVAPVPARSGEIVTPIGNRYVLAVYPWVSGTAHEFGPYPSNGERWPVVDLLVILHAAPTDGPALVDDCLIPGRADLEATVSAGAARWGPGPYAERTRRLVARHREQLGRVLQRYDELVGDVAGRAGPLVITHGEPHRGNTMNTPDGVVLIDWDTALLAPPERDLWMLLDEDPTVADRYEARAGVAVDPAAVDLYRLWWDLCEVSLYVSVFRGAHNDNDDTRVAWRGLTRHLDPDRWRHLL